MYEEVRQVVLCRMSVILAYYDGRRENQMDEKTKHLHDK
jgi:hypothetical protein